jgi:hypothetical protein
MQSAKAQTTEFKTFIGVNRGARSWKRLDTVAARPQRIFRGARRENKLFQNGTQNGFLRTQTVTCLPFIDSLFKSLSAIYQ